LHELPAVSIGQANVADQNVRACSIDKPEGIGHIPGALDVMPAVFQISGEVSECIGVIFHDENF